MQENANSCEKKMQTVKKTGLSVYVYYVSR